MPANFVELSLPEKKEKVLKFGKQVTVTVKRTSIFNLSQTFLCDELKKDYGTVTNFYYFYLNGVRTVRLQVTNDTVMEVWNPGIFLTTYI